MKKTKKRVLGLLGLILVVITTIFAAFLPGPEASAVDATSVTDTIVVRVVGSVADVHLAGIENNAKIVFPDQSFTASYENANAVSVKIYKDGGENPIYVDDIEDPNYNYGEKEYSLDLLSDGYGYGEYKIVISGTSFDGYPVEDYLVFSFYPVTGEIEEDDSDGSTYLDLNYDTSNEKIKTIEINIYDEDGNLVSSMSPITVEVPGKQVELPFAESDLETGNYKITISAYDSAGRLLYGKPYTLYYYYETLPVPDTGGMFGNLNVSRTDYLITGLLIFLSAAILGIIFVAKGRNSRRATIRRRR